MEKKGGKIEEFEDNSAEDYLGKMMEEKFSKMMEGNNYSPIQPSNDVQIKNYQDFKQNWREMNEKSMIINKKMESQTVAILVNQPSLEDVLTKYSRTTKDHLQINTSMKNTVLYGEILEDSYTINSVHTLIIDENKDVIKVCLYNCGGEEIFTKGRRIGILEPYSKYGEDGILFIRVDSRNNLILEEDLGKEVMAEELKTKGNAYFKAENYLLALDYYSQAIERSPECSIYYSNRSLANIKLGRYLEAKLDAERAIKYGGRTDKYLFRLVNAYSALRSHIEAINVLEEIYTNIKDKSSKYGKDIKKEIKIEGELEEQMNKGEYNILELLKEVDNADVKIEEFTGNIEIVEIEGKGRGIIATSDIPKRELICVSKAFSYVNSGDVDIEGEGSRITKRVIEKTIERIQRYNILVHKINTLSICSQYPPIPDIKLLLNSDPRTTLHPTKTEINIDTISKICKKNIFKANSRTISKIMKYPERECKGLWILPSFFNHSCDPNTILLFIGDAIFIRAGKYIYNGEEITLPYQPPRDKLEERQINLLQTWDFICECHRCKSEALIPLHLGEKIEYLYGRLNIPTLNLVSILEIYSMINTILDELKDILKEKYLTGIPASLLFTMILVANRLHQVDEKVKASELYNVALNNSSTILGLQIDYLLGPIAFSQKIINPDDFNSKKGIFWNYLGDIFGDDVKLLSFVAKRLMK